MTNREKRIFNIAKEISLMSDFDGAHLGAVVVHGKTILSTGYNSVKTNPLQHKYNIYRNFEHYENSIPSVHAEISALSRLIGRKDIEWDKISVFTYRQLKNGKPACSKPCKSCMKLIRDLGIKEVYYINEFGNYCEERVL